MMTLPRITVGLLLVAAIAGTVSDVAPNRPPVFAGGYRVLAVDLHVHTFPLSASTLAPWDVAIQARHDGLDAIAVTAHDMVLPGLVGRWFGQRFGGAIVLAGEEIHGPSFHLIAAGIHKTISWRKSAADAIDEIHRQGGVAIAAHPVFSAWPAYRAAGALYKLDGTEVLQPVAYSADYYARALREFYRDSGAAAIGSSDYHGFGPLGLCRTYVFVREPSEHGILDAIRAKRTVVLDGTRAYGDPRLIPLLPSPPAEPANPLAFLSRCCGILGMLGLTAINRRRKLT